MFRFINNMHDKSQIVAWKIHFQHSPLSETRFKQILSSGIFEFYDCPEIGSIVDYKPIVIFNQEEALLGYFSSQVKEALQKYPEQSFAQKFSLCNRQKFSWRKIKEGF